MSYKIGDRVRHTSKGIVGTVVDLDEGDTSYPIRVQWDGFDEYGDSLNGTDDYHGVWPCVTDVYVFSQEEDTATDTRPVELRMEDVALILLDVADVDLKVSEARQVTHLLNNLIADLR